MNGSDPIVLVGFCGWDAVAIECARPFAPRNDEWLDAGYSVDFVRLSEAKRLVGLYIVKRREAA